LVNDIGTVGPLAGKVAWITGAGSGIGEACAIAFARAGARIVLTGRQHGPLEAVAAQIGTQAVVCAGDVSKPGVAAAIIGTIAAFGRLDFVGNAAGSNVAARSWRELTTASIASLVDGNLNAALYVTHVALPLMRAGGGGVFVHIGSWVARFPSTLAGPVYTAAKTAIVAMSHTVNMEEGINGIRSCVLSPGEVVTPLMDKRPVPITADERALMLKASNVGDFVMHIVSLPAHVCINEVVMSPTANRLHH
jgi:NADP-dependent 3-hydroxy acid dehydrogenase YdfG